MKKFVVHIIPNAHLDPVWLWDYREGLNEGVATCRTILYDSGRPILERAQQAGVARADVEVQDAMRLVQGLGAVAFPSDDDRDRVVGLAIDGLRAAH